MLFSRRMSANTNPNPRPTSGRTTAQPTVKYHRDLYYLGKCILRLGVSLMVITLVAKLAFGGISPVLIIVLSGVSILLVIIGIVRITFSYSALRADGERSPTNPTGIATISNFQAFIRNNRRNEFQSGNQSVGETIHCGNRSFGSPSLVLPPSYEPPPSYEQIQKDAPKDDHSQVKSYWSAYSVFATSFQVNTNHLQSFIEIFVSRFNLISNF